MLVAIFYWLVLVTLLALPLFLLALALGALIEFSMRESERRSYTALATPEWKP